jgi:predicted molibdopterin-dependent oxidoreductase YjgC
MKTREELLNQLGQLEGYFDELEIFQVLAKDYSADAVDRILSAPTQAQLDCPYCHGKADLNDTTNSSFQINLDTSDDNDYRLQVDYKDEFYDYDNSAIIHYCPACGRKLGDE